MSLGLIVALSFGAGIVASLLSVAGLEAEIREREAELEEMKRAAEQ